MKVGIDVESIDQRVMTEKVCQDKDVQYVRLGYNQILEKTSGWNNRCCSVE